MSSLKPSYSKGRFPSPAQPQAAPARERARLQLTEAWEYVRDIGYCCKMALRALRHPFDVFGGIRSLGRGAGAASVLLLLAAYFVLLLSKLTTSYIFDPTEASRINPITLLLQYGLPWITWVCANYLISSIMRGQGRLAEVFVGSAFALMPVVLFSLPLAVLTNVLTLNEKVLVDTGETVILVWTVVLIYIQVKEVHNYELFETGWNIIVSVLFMVGIWVLIFIFAGLSFQVYDFVVQIVREVSYRG